MTGYHAAVEPRCAIIRVWADGKRYGDEYEFASTVIWVSPTKVEVAGTMTAPTPQQINAMAKALYALGVTEAFWVRYEDGKRREFSVDVRARALR